VSGVGKSQPPPGGEGANPKGSRVRGRTEPLDVLLVLDAVVFEEPGEYQPVEGALGKLGERLAVEFGEERFVTMFW